MNILIAHPELSDAGAVTASSANSSFPVTNLQTIQPSTAWRSTTLTSVYLEVDLGASYALNFVALIRTNATSSAQWRIRLASTQAGLTAGPSYDSGTIDQWPETGLDDLDFTNAFNYSASMGSARWARIDFTDAANPDGYFQAGRIYVSNAWVPTRNFSYGWGIGFEDDSVIDITDGGNLLPTIKGKRRVQPFELNFSSEAEMMGYAFEYDRMRGKSGDIIVARDLDGDYPHKTTVYGLNTELQPIINQSYGVFAKRYQITEMI